VSVQSALVMYPIYAFGSDEQKNTWLPALQKARAGMLRLTEPDFGSIRRHAHARPRRFKIRTERREDVDHVGQIADVAIIWQGDDEATRCAASLWKPTGPVLGG